MQGFMIALLICSVAMSVLALLYMACTPFLAKRYSERGRYYAWLIIVVGLIIPFRPQWGNALFSVEVPSSTPPPVVQMSGEAPSQFFPPITLPLLPPIENVVASDTAINITWWHIAAAIWLAGAIMFIAFHGIKHYRFMKVARRWSEKITDEKILALFESLKSEMGISKRIPTYLCPFAGSPMMIGLFKPQIFLPTVELAQDELHFILKHELVHYRRKDLLYKCLVLAARALHWFNPAVHLMAKAVNVLCETSCDAEVLRSADTETRQFYGETIIGVAQHQSKLCTALSTNFYGGRKSMKTRIASIMDTRTKKAGIIVACLVLTLAISTGFIIASTPAQAEAVPPHGEIIVSNPDGELDEIQPGLMPGEPGVEPGENWPLHPNHAEIRINEDGVEYSLDGGETWTGGTVNINLDDFGVDYGNVVTDPQIIDDALNAMHPDARADLAVNWSLIPMLPPQDALPQNSGAVVDAEGRIVVRDEVIDYAMPVNSPTFDAFLNDAAARYMEYRLANPLPPGNNGFAPTANNYGVISEVTTGEQIISSVVSPGNPIDLNASILSFIYDSDVFFVYWQGEQINLLADPVIYAMIQNGANLYEVFTVLGARG